VKVGLAYFAGKWRMFSARFRRNVFFRQPIFRSPAVRLRAGVPLILLLLRR